jgi:hypothetical protein
MGASFPKGFHPKGANLGDSTDTTKSILRQDEDACASVKKRLRLSRRKSSKTRNGLIPVSEKMEKSRELRKKDRFQKSDGGPSLPAIRVRIEEALVYVKSCSPSLGSAASGEARKQPSFQSEV